MATDPWNRGGQFASFWQHFDAAEKWRSRHVEMVRESLALAPENKKKKEFVGPSLSELIEVALGKKEDENIEGFTRFF